MFQGIKCVVQGADHIARNMICQDAADYKLTEHYAAAVVADGHGSAKYIRSDIGSVTAVKCAIETIDAYMEDYGLFSKKIRENPDYILRKMGEQFLARWTQAVEDYQDAHPLTEEEKEKLAKAGADLDNIYTFYGSTVLAAVMGEDFSYGFLVGDGGFVRIDEKGEACIPIEDKNSYANYVSSICSKNAVDALDTYFKEGRPLALCVSTDGLIKSFDSEKDFLDYHILLTPMLTNLEMCQVSMNKNFQKRTVSGSGDDISMAVVFETGQVEAAQDLLKSKIERNRAEKNAREEQERLAHLKFLEKQNQKKGQQVKEALESLGDKKRKAEENLEAQKKNKERIQKDMEKRLSEAEKDQQNLAAYIKELDAKIEEMEKEHLQIQENHQDLKSRQQDAEKSESKWLEMSSKLMDRIGALGEHLSEKLGFRPDFEDDESEEIREEILPQDEDTMDGREGEEE